MSEAVTRAAYRFVDALENYNKASNEEMRLIPLESIDDPYTPEQEEAEERVDEAWYEYQASKDNLIQTVNVERSGVKLG